MTILPQLPSGAAVLLQKPMGETLEEATAIRDHCRQRGLVAAVNFQLRYSPNNLAAVALEQAGLLGELHDMEVQVRTYTPWKLWTFLATAPTAGDPLPQHSLSRPHPLLVRQSPRRLRKDSSKPANRSARSHQILDPVGLRRVEARIRRHQSRPRLSRRRRTAASSSGKGQAGAIRMDMGVNLDYPKGVPDTLSYAERGSLRRTMESTFR